MGDKNESSESVHKSFAQVTIGCSGNPNKRKADCEREIDAKKRRTFPDDSSCDKSTQQSSRNSSHSNPQILPLWVRYFSKGFETEEKLKNSKPADADIRGCYSWEAFLDSWEGKRKISDSTSEIQHREKTTEEIELCLPGCSTSIDTTRQKSASDSQLSVFPNEQIKKLLCVAKTAEKVKTSSYAEEMEMIVRPVPSNTKYNAMHLVKKTKINLWENNQLPPFPKILISLDSESASDFDFSNTEKIMHLLEKKTPVEENISDGANNSTDKVLGFHPSKFWC